MLEDTAMLRTYFSKLGLDSEVADIYLALQAYGPQSISELSRRAKVERTRIYRLIETLTSVNLIEIETHYKRNILKAAPINNLQILLSKREEELHQLQKEFTLIEQAIENQKNHSHTTQVQFYRGSEGLKQMFWNETKSTTENLAILYENMQGRTNASFFERWVREVNQRNTHSRAIIGDHFLHTQKEWYRKKDNERVANWEARYAPADVFNITHSCVVYNDIVAYYNWRGDSAFGIELHNKEIADAQRAFFEMLWQQSTSIPKSVSQRSQKSTQ